MIRMNLKMYRVGCSLSMDAKPWMEGLRGLPERNRKWLLWLHGEAVHILLALQKAFQRHLRGTSGLLE